jgi:hypothetical protein
MVSAVGIWVIGTAVLAAALDLPPVGETTSEDPLAIQARAACAAGKVDEGIHLLTEYLRRTNDPTSTFNMARCYQLNGMPEPALLRFREYLRQAGDLPAEERREVDAYIRELEAHQRATAAATRPASPPVAGVTTNPVATEGRGRPKLRTAGLVLGGMGALALGTGTVFGMRVRSANQDLDAEERKSSPDAAYYKRRLDEGERAESRQFVFLGIGGAALAAGAVCYFFGLARRAPAELALVPWSGPGVTGATLQARY